MNERQRLEQVMASENMTANQFAKEIGVQAGTVSNIVNGRNNPSLDVLQRVLNRFRTISSDWLILGVGSMYRLRGEVPENALFDIKPIEPKKEDSKQESANGVSADAENTLEAGKVSARVAGLSHKKVEKVVIFYSDGTFEER